MKNIRIFYLLFSFLVVLLSTYLNRHVYIMVSAGDQMILVQFTVCINVLICQLELLQLLRSTHAQTEKQNFDCTLCMH